MAGGWFQAIKSTGQSVGGLHQRLEWEDLLTRNAPRVRKFPNWAARSRGQTGNSLKTPSCDCRSISLTVAGTPEQFGLSIRQQLEQYAKLVKISGAKLD